MSDVCADWIEPEAPAVSDDWLQVEDPNAGKTPLAFQHLVDACMRGTDRVMATDHRYMAFRPFNHEKDKVANPATRERVARFLAEGKWKHLGTYDEVQVYELLDGNPYHHKKNYVIGQNYRDDIDKVARAAIERHWSDYHDILEGMAKALKSGRDPMFARSMWGDTLQHIAVRIKQLGGDAAPSEREINQGFMDIRRARGIASKSGGQIMTLDSNSLPKVGFEVSDWIDDYELEQKAGLPAVVAIPDDYVARAALVADCWSRLSDKQRVFLSALRECRLNIRAAARSLGYNGTSSHRLWMTQPDYATVVRVFRANAGAEALDRDRLLARHEDIVETLLTPKPILHMGHPTGFEEVKADAAAKANETLMRVAGMFPKEGADVAVGVQLPAITVELTAPKGETVEGQSVDVDPSVPA